MKCKEEKQEKYKNIICPNCNSKDVIKRGTRLTENRGEIQRYGCNTCKKRFVEDDGFFRMRNTPNKITQAIDLFYRGVSTRKVQEHLGIFHPHNASNVSVYNWVVKYAKKIAKFTDNLKIKSSFEVQVDEMRCLRRKFHIKGHRGVEENWFIDSIDPATKFLVSSEYSRARGARDIKPVMQNIKDKTGNQIQMVTTDGLNAYPDVIRKTWGYNLKLKRYSVMHNRVVVSEEEGNFNYPIERFHNTARARTKVMRGFHGSIHSANAIMKGFSIYYNFVTKHQQIKCCPYELAIPALAIELNPVKNKWIGLITLASQNT